MFFSAQPNYIIYSIKAVNTLDIRMYSSALTNLATDLVAPLIVLVNLLPYMCMVVDGNVLCMYVPC